MYAGFITHRHALKRFGVHQRLDQAAYDTMKPFLAVGSFPPAKQILHFEGPNGPDGLKVKSPGQEDPAHFYNPLTGEGEVPGHISDHYRKLVAALRAHDQVRSAFEASWLAHYVVDGLTPAHHFPEHALMGKIKEGEFPVKGRFKLLARGEGALKKNWAVWGGNDVLATHQNFELGIAMTLVGKSLKVSLDEVKLAQARQTGYLEYFKAQALAVAKLDLYTKFQVKGWTAQIGSIMKNQVIPLTVQTVAIIWLLAYLEAGMIEVQKVALAAAA